MKRLGMKAMVQEYDQLFEGEAAEVAAYHLTSSVRDYTAVIVEVSLFDEVNSVIRQYEYIPAPDLADTAKRYSHLAQVGVGRGRWYMEWYFSREDVLEVSFILNESPLYDIKITRVFGVKEGAAGQEVDPTVPDWAKEPVKPSYTKEEVGLGNVDNTRDAVKHVAHGDRACKDENGAVIHDTYLKKGDFTGRFKQGVQQMKDTDLLDSLEEIKTNTERGKFAGALAIKELRDEISNKSSGTVLWENPSPSIVPVSITLNSQEYDVLEVFFLATTSNRICLSYRTLKGYHLRAASPWNQEGGFGCYSRDLRCINDMQYNVGKAYAADISNLGMKFTDVSRTNLIPLMVIGYK